MPMNPRRHPRPNRPRAASPQTPTLIRSICVLPLLLLYVCCAATAAVVLLLLLSEVGIVRAFAATADVLLLRLVE